MKRVSRLRAVDYIGNLGGGARFVDELVRALRQLRPELEVEIVSHGVARDNYLSLFADSTVTVLDLPPRPSRLHGMLAWFPSGRVRRRLQSRAWSYTAPKAAFRDADVVWFPWIHRHVPALWATPVVGSLHDLIMIEHRGLISESLRRQEGQLTRSWLTSSARLAISSHATAETAHRLFGVGANRFRVIPLTGEHRQVEVGLLPLDWSWTAKPFMLFPANTFPHKNHDRLLSAFAAATPRMPLVLTGPGSELPDSPRGRELRKQIAALGLEVGTDVICLGLVPDESYVALLGNASAVVMPTLGEGGGSFPVMEALLHGVPVACSDIPVLREQLQRMNADSLLFNPYDVADITEAIQRLATESAELRRHFRDQVAQIIRRTWLDVAADYLSLFDESLGAG